MIKLFDGLIMLVTGAHYMRLLPRTAINIKN